MPEGCPPRAVILGEETNQISQNGRRWLGSMRSVGDSEPLSGRYFRDTVEKLVDKVIQEHEQCVSAAVFSLQRENEELRSTLARNSADSDEDGSQNMVVAMERHEQTLDYGTEHCAEFCTQRPSVGAGIFKVLPLWQRDDGMTGHSSGKQRGPTTAYPHAILHHAEDLEPVASNTSNSWVSRFISYPSSPYRLIWDVQGMFLIAYDIITIPLVVFSTQEEIFFVFFAWVSRIFWTSDMIASVCVGFVDQGDTIMEPKRIIIHYLKTWFLVDCITNIPDWLGVFLVSKDGSASGGSASSITRLVRALRIMRVLRLLRLAKLKRIVNELYDRIDSEYVSIIMNILKIMVLLLAVNHFIACLWFLLGDVDHKAGSDRNWVSEYVVDDDWHYQYFTSLHWSLTMFTPASMHVQPQNLRERMFSILIIMLALLSFSSLVGSITSSMTQLRSMKEDSWKQFWLLRRYLRQRGVPRTLVVRIERYLEFKSEAGKQQVLPSKVPILGLLSEQLQDELQCAITLPHIAVHPLFNHISENFNVSMNRMSRNAITRKSLACNDSLFIVGDKAAHMSFIVSGVFSYMRGEESMMDESIVSTDHWLCEPVLWTPWNYVGELQATTECDLILIHADKLGQVVVANPSLFHEVQEYAANFVDWLNSPEFRKDMTDVFQTSEMQSSVHEWMGQSPSAIARKTSSEVVKPTLFKAASLTKKPLPLMRRVFGGQQMPSSSTAS
eukprot:TRINITY_DN44738_c0_g1_i1.p1 TRINITY_DN44738_c0_g1~~TRINITY_DN44738_c0_g1_i1.p1  ORF type:complete len:755 (+),score=120.95 TRINITY_DN44738_c0_g1_i1:91-2265(+)